MNMTATYILWDILWEKVILVFPTMLTQCLNYKYLQHVLYEVFNHGQYKRKIVSKTRAVTDYKAGSKLPLSLSHLKG